MISYIDRIIAKQNLPVLPYCAGNNTSHDPPVIGSALGVIFFNVVFRTLFQQLSIRCLFALANNVAIYNFKICCGREIPLPGDTVQEVCLGGLAEFEWSIRRFSTENNH